MLGLFDQANHGHCGRGVDRAIGALVVETDVAASDRCVKSAAGFREAAHGFTQLPKDFGTVRIAEVEIVSDAEWTRAGASEIAGGFGNGDFGAFARIEIDVCGIAIDRERKELFDSGAGVPSFSDAVWPWRPRKIKIRDARRGAWPTITITIRQ